MNDQPFEASPRSPPAARQTADGWLRRLPASFKLATTVAIVVTTVLVPPERLGWFLGPGVGLVLIAVGSRIPPGQIIRRLILLSPFVLGVALAGALRPAGGASWLVVAIRSTLCLTAVILASHLTPFGDILVVLRRVRVPALLVTTLALMHRYLFVLKDEAGRMQRARASRSFASRRRTTWHVSASVVGVLFVRASERAERIYGAMCARGWK